ncbi:uncharacterized protein A4U43_C04F34600 [Asparagus officinalis]|uniref:Uncharacterized protein n=1 Tax=Asparagus officinalis TaxID=4686 RepID=A0A5P1F6I8_ASPOF|nr:uncharacterized protein A4U43_C04F34600 [Asparagus officinalis]
MGTPRHEEEKRAYARGINSRWQTANRGKVEFFSLASLWEQYAECSSYGLGIPIHLKNGEPAIQYYTPYLSAIQLYTTNPIATSSDSVVSGFGHEGLRPQREGNGHLYLEFIDGSSPYDRLPLFSKILEIAKVYPGLLNFRSADISPPSWMSVAWYPIYQIPPQRNARESSTCFLTYHSLSTKFEDFPQKIEKQNPSKSGRNGPRYKKVSREISIPSFGLASLKMQGSPWEIPTSEDHNKFVNLYNAAESWLKQMGVQHHDFIFFRNRSSGILDMSSTQFCSTP